MILDKAFAWQEYDNDPKWSIWSWLELQREDWDEVVREYWGLDTESCPEHLEFPVWERARRDAVLAERLIAATIRLSLEASSEARSPERLSEERLKKLRQALPALKDSPQIRDLVGLKLAEELLHQVADPGPRLFKLAGLVSQSALSAHAAAYMERTTRLYLFGFDPEAAVMARAVLGKALADAITVPVSRAGMDPTLDDLITEAASTGALPGRRASKSRRGWTAQKDTPLWHADEVRKAGNHAAHEEPGFRPPDDGLHDAFNVIRSLSKVLEHLFPLRRSWAARSSM